MGVGPESPTYFSQRIPRVGSRGRNVGVMCGSDVSRSHDLNTQGGPEVSCSRVEPETCGQASGGVRDPRRTLESWSPLSSSRRGLRNRADPWSCIPEQALLALLISAFSIYIEAPRATEGTEIDEIHLFFKSRPAAVAGPSRLEVLVAIASFAFLREAEQSRKIVHPSSPSTQRKTSIR